MNKLFGYFKQKIVQANVQNKKDLQSLVSVLSGDDTGYKSQQILSHLQKIKSNYMTWSILIANEASTGLYYSQLHNHGVCLRKANSEEGFEVMMEKLGVTQKQMKKTHQELKEVAGLSEGWVSAMSKQMEGIKELRNKQLEEKKKKSKEKIETKTKQSLASSKQLTTHNPNTPTPTKPTTPPPTKEPSNQANNDLSQQSSPIILSETISPIIQFSPQHIIDQPVIVHSQKW